jgi:hypothetical protein
MRACVPFILKLSTIVAAERPLGRLKKILILTAGFGDGEDAAAWNLHAALEHLAPRDARVEVLDLLDSCYGRFHD